MTLQLQDHQEVTSLVPGPSALGSKVRAFSSPQTHRRFMNVVRQSARDCSSVARWLIELAVDQGLVDGLQEGESVEGHSRGGPSIVFRLPPRPYAGFKLLAADRKVCVSHLMGLAVERALELREDPEWIEHFGGAEDLVERVLEALLVNVDPWLLRELACTR